MYPEEYKMCGCDCEPQRCCFYTPGHRHFFTKAEEIEHLKQYKKELEKEMTGVEEKIHEMTK
jgi:hypothetical protein